MLEEIQAGVHNFHCYFNFVNLCIRFQKLIQGIEELLHGHVEIQNFSLSVKKYFTSESSERVKYFLTQEEKFCISSGHVMFY